MRPQNLKITSLMSFTSWCGQCRVHHVLDLEGIIVRFRANRQQRLQVFACTAMPVSMNYDALMRCRGVVYTASSSSSREARLQVRRSSVQPPICDSPAVGSFDGFGRRREWGLAKLFPSSCAWGNVDDAANVRTVGMDGGREEHGSVSLVDYLNHKRNWHGFRMLFRTAAAATKLFRTAAAKPLRLPRNR